MSTCTALRLASLVGSLDQLGAPSQTPASPEFKRAGLLRRTTSAFSTFSSFQPVHRPSSRSTKLQQALQALSSSPAKADLDAALRALKSAGPPPTGGDVSAAALASSAQGDERLLEWTLLARVVLAKYGLRVDELVKSAGEWEDEIDWWKRLDGAGRWAWGGIGGYFVQSAYPPRRSFE